MVMTSSIHHANAERTRYAREDLMDVEGLTLYTLPHYSSPDFFICDFFHSLSLFHSDVKFFSKKVGAERFYSYSYTDQTETVLKERGFKDISEEVMHEYVGSWVTFDSFLSKERARNMFDKLSYASVMPFNYLDPDGEVRTIITGYDYHSSNPSTFIHAVKDYLNDPTPDSEKSISKSTITTYDYRQFITFNISVESGKLNILREDLIEKLEVSD